MRLAKADVACSQLLEAKRRCPYYVDRVHQDLIICASD
jgi:hypothetical protein